MSDLVVEEINDIERFRTLRDTWNTLLKGNPDNHIFLTWEWLFSWWQYHNTDKKLRIILVKDNGKVIAIAPMMQSRERKGIFRFDILENICGKNCDSSGIILTERKEECVTSLLEHLGKLVQDSGIIVRLWHIPELSGFLGVLRRQYPSFSRSLYLTERPASSCPYIDLAATGEEYSRTLRGSSHKTLRKQLRRLEKDHVVAFRVYTGDTDLRLEMEPLFRLHKKRWYQKGVTSKFTRMAEQDFYIDVSRYFWKNGWLNLSFIDVDGKTVSVVWGFDYADTFLEMTSSFDTDYSAYSIGAIHWMRRLEDCIRNGRTKFDFSKGDEPYKFRWADHTVNNVLITITGSGIVGRAKVTLLNALPKAGLLRPASLWRRYTGYLRTRKKGN